jgi:small subunit ribosomal protein S21
MDVTSRDGESFEQLLRRFKTGVERAGILRDLKRKRYFRPKSVVRREKARMAARRRNRKQRPRT